MQQEYLHGGITCVDIEKVLLAKGFEPVSFPGHDSFSITSKASRFLFLFKMIFRIKRGSIVFFISPVYAKMNRLLLRLIRLKGVKLICIIADIDGLRDRDDHLLQSELEQYRGYSCFIVHNDQMAGYLRQHLSHPVLCTLEFFDYLVPSAHGERQKSHTIVFAANLAKSGFLDKLHLVQPADPGLVFNIYGPGITETIAAQENVRYLGTHKPYDLPAIVEGSFGLIWDGVSIDTCEGGYGEYLRYNLQHKLSFYIVSKLPVIVWDGAATAELVNKYRIGFTIKNLYEIEDKVKAVTQEQYRQMQINMQPLAEKISKGGYMGDAIDEIMKLAEA